MTKRNASERARQREARVLRKAGRHGGHGALPVAMPKVGVIMGSKSDWETMRHASEMLDGLGIPHEVAIVSAHRTPDWLFEYSGSAKARGLHVIIAGAGGAAHLPGMCASKTELPVLGVPVESQALRGMDSLLSIVQMPGGVPVATFAIGKPGAINAALCAGAILALSDTIIASKLAAFRLQQTRSVLEQGDPRRERSGSERGEDRGHGGKGPLGDTPAEK